MAAALIMEVMDLLDTLPLTGGKPEEEKPAEKEEKKTSADVCEPDEGDVEEEELEEEDVGPAEEEEEPGVERNGSNQDPDVLHKKILLIGEPGVGKTSLLNKFLDLEIPLVPPSVLAEVGRYTGQVPDEDGALVQMTVWDIPVHDQYEDMRRDAYVGTDAVILCFAVDHPGSLFAVHAHWSHEVVNYIPGVPVVLTGMKKDLREDPGTIAALAAAGAAPVSYETGLALKDELVFEYYIECSSVTGEGVDDVFKAAVSAKKEDLPELPAEED